MTIDIYSSYFKNIFLLILMFCIPIIVLSTLMFIFKVRTVVDVYDEDWKTAIAQHKEIIPANTELEVLNVLTNFYGRWLEVIYNNSHYYIDPSKVEFAGKIDKEVENERFRRCS